MLVAQLPTILDSYAKDTCKKEENEQNRCQYLGERTSHNVCLKNTKYAVMIRGLRIVSEAKSKPTDSKLPYGDNCNGLTENQVHRQIPLLPQLESTDEEFDHLFMR